MTAATIEAAPVVVVGEIPAPREVLAEQPCVAGNGCTVTNCLFTGSSEADKRGQAACEIC